MVLLLKSVFVLYTQKILVGVHSFCLFVCFFQMVRMLIWLLFWDSVALEVNRAGGSNHSSNW